MNFNKKLITIGAVLAASLTSVNTVAETQSLDADVEFVVAIAFTNPTNLNFGKIRDNLGTNSIIVGTDGVPSGSGFAGSYLSGAQAGSVDIAGSLSQINIQLTNFSSDDSAIYQLSLPTCSYNGATAVACAATDSFSITPSTTAATPLTIGLTLTGVAVTAGVYDETFDVVALYN
jgi:hypothetical protein